MISSFFNLVEIQAAVKKQKMTIDLEGITDKYVYMDWTRISQVLINLINNAIKYTPVGGHIDVIVKEDCNNNIGDNIHNYIIIVKDNGRGIDEKDMPSLFDLYTRGAYDNDISVEGTGLGLSISKQIIELMNGTIDVDSKLGEGTTFTVKLPLQYVVRTQADKNITDNGTDNNIIENDQSLSSSNALAVIATIGISCHLSFSNCLIKRVASKPSISGIHTSIRIISTIPFDIDTFAETVLEYVKY